MQPIPSPDTLRRGATLYHSAFGFAHVREVKEDCVVLDWERPGEHLPQQVSYEALKRVYVLCSRDGFFHRALRDRDRLTDVLVNQPAEALTWLLDDLDTPQRVRDVMDWLVSRELFTPKTFTRWWSTTVDRLREDNRFKFDGEWLRRVRFGESASRQAPSPPIDDDTATRAEGQPESGPAAPIPPHEHALTDVLLAQSAPPGRTIPALGAALAKAIALYKPTLTHISADTISLRPDGSILLAPRTATSRAPAAPIVTQAAIALLQALLRRPLPAGVAPARLLPYLRHVAPDLPPSALAPLASALRSDPSDVPDLTSWQRAWADIVATEASRAQAHKPDAHLVVGYDSHIGRAKLLTGQTNQDALRVQSTAQAAFAVLADGISLCDTGSGDIAAHLTVHTALQTWQRLQGGSLRPARLVDRAAALANLAVCGRTQALADGNLAGRIPMGATFLSACAQGNRLTVSWLGDSRAYLVGPWGASLLTADDHTAADAFIAWYEGRAQAWFPDSHALTRYVGHFDRDANPASITPQHCSFTLLEGERLVLTSDGITDYIGRDEPDLLDELARYARAGSVDQTAQRLVARANAGGGGDNATAIVLEIG